MPSRQPRTPSGRWPSSATAEGDPAAAAWLDRGALGLCPHLIITGAWWDVVEEVATHPVGDGAARDLDLLRFAIEANLDDRPSALSRREATKHLP